VNKKKCVLILTVDTGFGHRSAANAVADAIDEKYRDDCVCMILNPMRRRSAPFFLRQSQETYDTTVRASQRLYYLMYQMSDTFTASAFLDAGLTVSLYQTMKEVLAEVRPDIILSTSHLYHAPLGTALSYSHSKPPLYSIITDLYEVHKLWFQPSPDRFFVGSEAVRDQAVASGIPPEKVCVSGIPVNPRIANQNQSKAGLRRQLGWDEQLLTILAVGSRRINHLAESLVGIDDSRFSFQIVAVAGGDDGLHEQFLKTRWKHPIFIYNYVDCLPDMLHAADVLISKAGGLITAEGLACNLPMILVDAIPGQETGNVRYICQNGAGVFSNSPAETLAVLDGWLKDDQRELKQISLKARQLGKPQAAYLIAEEVWQSIN
jgi:1,2-diacylglycerol 3-beta-galactosyltransferase